MKRFFNFLAWVTIGGTLGMNHIHWTSFSFWIILIAVIIAEHTTNLQ